MQALQMRTFISKLLCPSLLFESNHSLSKIRNQEDIVQNTMLALRPLVGRGWKGHGDAVFFVMGAYRNQEGTLRTFT